MSEIIEQEIRTLRAQFWSERDPEGRAFAPLADAYRRKGDLDEAGSLVEDGLARIPDFTPGHLVAARIQRARGDLEGARASLDRVLDLDSANLLALLERAELARDTGDLEGAVADLRQLLELDSGHLGARAALDRLEAAGAPGSQDARAPATAETREQELDPADRGTVGIEEAAEPGTGEIETQELEVEGGEGDVFDFDLSAFEEGESVTSQDEGAFETEDLVLDGQDQELDTDGLVLDADDEIQLDEPYVDFAREDDEPAVTGVTEESGELDRDAIPVEPDAGLDEPTGESEEDSSLVTRTMAELFVRQGLTDRAVEVYEKLLDRDPANEELVARLEELRTTVEADAELSDVAPQWAEDEPEDAGVATPFAWGEEEEEGETLGQEDATGSDARSPRTIREHFDDLLAWEPGAVSVEDLAPGAAPDTAPEGSLAALKRDGPPMPSTPEPETDDDDLDDFRSWLQSLDS